MVTAAVIVVCLATAACGRAKFDPLGDAARDGIDDADPGPSPRSCAGLTPTCGPAGASPCCETPIVSGGSFLRSYDVGDDSLFPDPANPATVSTFRLDKYEVTVARFRQFVADGQGTQQNPPAIGAGGRMLNGLADQGGWDPTFTDNLEADTAALIAGVKCDPTFQTWTDTPGANEDLPINCLTWFEAMAFCSWDDGFLPTEAEWNYAAVGGNEQRAYPWSVPASSLTIDCSYANYNNGGFCVNPPTGAANRVGSESPQGDGRWGQSDLAGNLWEWALDWHAAAYSNPCTDCANFTLSTGRVYRGGRFLNPPAVLRGAHRNLDGPAVRDDGIGVRCARAR